VIGVEDYEEKESSENSGSRKISGQSDELKKGPRKRTNSDLGNLSSNSSSGLLELGGDNYFNVDHVVRSWVKDYIKRTKVQKNLTEIFINQNSF